MALYPQTTCFYKAVIHEPPARVSAKCVLRDGSLIKARLLMRFLMQFSLHFYCNFCCKCKRAAISMQFDPYSCAMFTSVFPQIATKLHDVSNMFETSATEIAASSHLRFSSRNSGATKCAYKSATKIACVNGSLQGVYPV